MSNPTPALNSGNVVCAVDPTTAIGGSILPVRGSDPGGSGAMALFVGDVVPGVAATNLGKADAAAYVTSDVGVCALAVVDDGTAPMPASGQYTPPRINPTTRGAIVSTDVQTSLDAGVAATGVLVTKTSINGFKTYALQVTKSGNVTSWDVRLEVTLDGTNWSPVITHTQADGTGVVKPVPPSLALLFPSLTYRVNVVALVIGLGFGIDVASIAMV